jgi:hypothetical protein
MAFNWFKKKDPTAGVEGSKGKRTTDGKSSPKGWTYDRAGGVSRSTKPKVDPKDIGGYPAGGRSGRGKPKQS